jgi:hypothetical protein
MACFCIRRLERVGAGDTRAGKDNHVPRRDDEKIGKVPAVTMCLEIRVARRLRGVFHCRHLAARS